MQPEGLQEESVPWVAGIAEMKVKKFNKVNMLTMAARMTFLVLLCASVQSPH